MNRTFKDGSPPWLLPAMLAFGLFVLFDIGLFGVLIFRSLSQREIQKILLEARSEAEELAEQIADEAERRGQDLWTAVASESETQTYIDSVLSQRKIVERVEIKDREGRVVFRSEREETQGGAPEVDADRPLPRIETKSFFKETPFQEVEVPVGDFGTFVIGISRVELEERLQVLRAELIRQSGWIAMLTVVLFVAAYILVWRLVRRTQRLEEKAKEAERLAYVGTLASGLAHEIRSPLNSLQLNMQMLEEEVSETGTISGGRRLMAITRSEIERLEGLVTDFLSYARPRRLDPQEVEAVALLERTVEVLGSQIESQGAEVQVIDRAAGLRVRVDLAQMTQLLLNLTQNALEATQGTGRPARISLEARREGDELVLSIRDSGRGMTAEEQARMFEVFYSGRKGGTGLGLAIVERIARNHDGRIQVSSAPGEGTSVELRLPLLPAHPAERSEPVSATEPN